MNEKKTLRITLVIDTERSGWQAPEHASIEISEQQLEAMLRENGWKLPIHKLTVKKVELSTNWTND